MTVSRWSSQYSNVSQVMDATRKSEDEVSTALHDCDNDLDRAVNMLLEGEAQGEWVVTSGNKKKNRQSGAVVPSSREKGGDNNRDRSEPGESDRERSRTRGGPPRMRGRGSSDSRGCELPPCVLWGGGTLGWCFPF